MSKMEVGGHQDQLKRAALGRIANVGELYDVRRECTSSFSLLQKSFPENLIRHTDISQTEFDYKFTDNFLDRFDLINIEAELQMTVLLGLVKLEGSGKFLNCETKSENTVSCSLVCQMRTVNEKFFASFDEILQHVDLKLLQDPEYTHLITEINWGANCVLNLQFTCGSETNKNDIRGTLSAEFKKLKYVAISGGGHLEKESSSALNGENIEIRVFADVLPKKHWPTTVEGFCEFVAEVPNLLANVNGGKGKPLNYVMIPLQNIRKLANLEIDSDILVRKIDESFLMTTILFFEEIEQMKRKLNDLNILFSDYKNYIVEEDLRKAWKMKEELSIKESQLKLLISEDWVLVRSGEKTLKDLIKQIEKFKTHNLSMLIYEEYLDSCSAILKKITMVKNYTSLGIIYLGKGETFHSLQTTYPSHEIIVMVTSKAIELADPQLSHDTHVYFVTLAHEKKPNTKYVVLDLDNTGDEEFMGTKILVTRCFHLKGLKMINRDVLATYLADLLTNFVRPIPGTEVELCNHKPGNRVSLVIPCPGVETGTCPNVTQTWFCHVCKMNVEYGFDNNYYCTCGKKPVTAFEYRCVHSAHGDFFVQPSEKFLKDILKTLKPLNDMNVLVIGQSGVGKSTWINSIVNYLTYDSMDDARENGVICTIPAEMILYDPITFVKHKINVGNVSENEVTQAGHSATQQARTYSFLWEGRCVRIIDTPGLGDCRGINQDKENLNNIIDHIGYLKELHGVCILLKANDNRFNAMFKYCIKELLAHLHKSVTRNIVFCFTTSRSCVYTPGQASAALETVLENMGLNNLLSLGYHNMFSLDNEAFIFLCALENTDIQYSDVVKSSYAESWTISSNETKRLFNTIKCFQPHLLKETISLVTAKSRILSLTKPLAEISKTIQINIATMERKRKEIEESEMTIKELQKKLHYTEVQLEPEPLKLPRTVCTNIKCIEYISYRGSDVKEVLYKTHCHTECLLEKVTPKTVNNALLKNCDAMNNGICKVCRCGWEDHMHLTYSQNRVPKVQEDKKVKEHMEDELKQKNEIEIFLEKLQTKVEKYNSEQKEIIDASVKFGMFLRNNAITAFNDSVVDYMEYLIAEEEKKPYKSATEETILKNLRETLNRYHAEVRILQEVLEKSEDTMENLTIDDVYDLEQKLYKLELTGPSIKKVVEESRRSNRAIMEYSEKPLQINSNLTNNYRKSDVVTCNSQRGQKNVEKKKKKWWGF